MQAAAAGLLRARTRDAGLSLGDFSRLAPAISREATALTTDEAWTGLDLDVAVELAR